MCTQICETSNMLMMINDQGFSTIFYLSITFCTYRLLYPCGLGAPALYCRGEAGPGLQVWTSCWCYLLSDDIAVLAWAVSANSNQTGAWLQDNNIHLELASIIGFVRINRKSLQTLLWQIINKSYSQVLIFSCLNKLFSATTTNFFRYICCNKKVFTVQSDDILVCIT